MPGPSPKRLGEILVADYHVLDADIRLALQAQAKGASDRLGQFLMRRGILTDRDLATALGQQLGVPVVLSLTRLTIAMEVLQLVPLRCAEKKLVIPISLSGSESHRRLVLAMADPTDHPVIEALEGLTGFAIQPAIATEEEIRRAFKVFYLDDKNHVDLSELSDSIEVMRMRLHGGTVTEQGLGKAAKADGEIFRPKPLPIPALGDRPEEPTRSSRSSSVSVIPHSPFGEGSTVGAT